MSMGKRNEHQGDLFVASSDLETSGHPFYESLNTLLAEHDFDAFVEKTCESSYAPAGVGRPSVPPPIYFRMLFVGHFEGISSEREIAWRCADSLSLRRFLGLSLSDSVPNHSTLSLIRDRLDPSVYDEVFRFVLSIAAAEGLVPAKRIGVDSTKLESPASMRSIIRKDDGTSYSDYVKQLAAKAEPRPKKGDGGDSSARSNGGLASAEAAHRYDRHRRGKRTSNRDWTSAVDPDARITRMKNGTTRLGYKPEHAVDLDTSIVLAVSMNSGSSSDHASLPDTLGELDANLEHLALDLLDTELVADKGYHSNAAFELAEDAGMRTYIAEPKQPRRNWRRSEAGYDNKRRFYANRRRTKTKKGRELLRLRGCEVERSFAHLVHRRGPPRTGLRGLENNWKQYLTLTAAMNLGTVLRERIGAGTPKALAGLRLLVSLLMRVILAARSRRQPVFKPRPTKTPAKSRRVKGALSRSE